MGSLHKLTKPICEEQLKGLRQALESLQGNILQGHGRDHSVHIFLHFKAEQTVIRQWIQGLAQHITSAQQQLDETEQYRKYALPGRLFMSFFLSAGGYRYLNFDVPTHDAWFDYEAFPYGMKAYQPRLNDPPLQDWEKGYQNDIHAMVLLADDDEHFLQRETHTLLDGVKTHADICAIEQGRVMRNAQGYPVEHFGFVDGRSQPLFFTSDIKRESQQGGGTGFWDPDAGPNLVLVPDPYGRREYDSDGRVVKYHDSGSYMVFRKLEQRVYDFKLYEKKLAHALGFTGENKQRAGALIVGRFADGTPVVLHDSPVVRQRPDGQPDPVPNNFTYNSDLQGQKCPFQAHIRKVNPRDPAKKFRRIVRRGITYGTREKEPKDNPSLEELPVQGVGLLFMCYQKNIERQFLYLQHQWANNVNFPHKKAGIDLLIGQPEGGGTNRGKWLAQWDNLRLAPRGNLHEQSQSFEFRDFVTLKGGEFFFAPSLYFLKNIRTVDNQ